MPTLIDPAFADQQRQVIYMLHELNVAVHRVGHKHLTIAILRYAQDDTQSLTKEVYPHVAKCLGYSDWRAVEHSIRVSIMHGWLDRNPESGNGIFLDWTKLPPTSCSLRLLPSSCYKKPSRKREGQIARRF